MYTQGLLTTYFTGLLLRSTVLHIRKPTKKVMKDAKRHLIIKINCNMKLKNSTY